ncbi:MAG: hypothetical protein HFJ80_05045 [Clostridiales bacterium]|nr:hypothetical protein [Clostridiales bacterium]
MAILKKSGRRSLSAVLAVCLLFSCTALAGCNGQEKGKEPAAPSEEQLTAVRESLQTAGHMEGLGELSQMELYVNGQRTADTEMVSAKDNKIIYYTADKKRIVNFPDGYLMDLGLDWQPDFSLSPVRTRYLTDNAVLTITREKNTYPTMEEFVSACVTRYIKDDAFLAANRIQRIKENRTITVGEYTAERIDLKLDGMEEGGMANYSYAILTRPDSSDFYFFMLKYNQPEDLDAILATFEKVRVQGIGVYSKTFELREPENWSADTKAYYEKLKNQKHIDWGIFSANLAKVGMKSDVPALEKRMDYKFPIISEYIHYSKNKFPTELTQILDKEGRQLQLTYQFTSSNNTELAGYTPSLDIYRGRCDEELRAFAREVKAYGKPVLFRLNNEMNTDWTSYCGLTNMVDPDIFVASWVRMYKLFEEEGVNNTIWIFNPFDGSYPPCNWANFINYMPDSEYVQMIGLTGYESNNKNTNQSYQVIYDKIVQNYEPFFMDWPWIISEFACGSGANKENQESQAKWVEEMFDCFEQGRYPNIKVAVWFNGNDYTDEGQVKNRYALSVTNKSTMKAFKDGLAATQP